MKNIYCALLISISLLGGATAIAADEFSVAEKRVFLDDHLKTIAHSGTIHYRYTQSGKPEDSFDDKASVTVKEGADGKKAVTVDYLSGPNNMQLPEIGDAKGNPVVLYFLEKDVRDMHRLIGGQENYFRKRIRLALVDKAQVRPVMVNFNGQSVPASEIRITPYIDDPLKDRFGKFYTKSYTFTISDDVPGSIYEIRTQVDEPTTPAAPVMKSVLSLAALTN